MGLKLFSIWTSATKNRPQQRSEPPADAPSQFQGYGDGDHDCTNFGFDGRTVYRATLQR